MKACTKCGIEKEFSEFNVCKSKADGFTSNCKLCRSVAAKKYYIANREAITKRNKDWSKGNPDKIRKKSARAYHRNKSKPKNKSAKILRKMIERVLALSGNKKTSKTESYLGYSKAEFIERIESQFSCGMRWSNHGSLWHVDHIISISEFNKLGIDDPKIINALGNLRPMLASENISKKDGFELVGDCALFSEVKVA